MVVLLLVVDDDDDGVEFESMNTGALWIRL